MKKNIPAKKLIYSGDNIASHSINSNTYSINYKSMIENNKKKELEILFKVVIIFLVLSAIIFFCSTATVWGIILGIPQLLALPPVGMNFATLAILGIPMTFFMLLVSPFFTDITNYHFNRPKNISHIDETLRPMEEEYNAKNLIISILYNTIIYPILAGVVACFLLAGPFFIAIASGAPAFITTSYLSWSASNIAFLGLIGLCLIGMITKLVLDVMDNIDRTTKYYESKISDDKRESEKLLQTQGTEDKLKISSQGSEVSKTTSSNFINPKDKGTPVSLIGDSTSQQTKLEAGFENQAGKDSLGATTPSYGNDPIPANITQRSDRRGSAQGLLGFSDLFGTDSPESNQGRSPRDSMNTLEAYGALLIESSGRDTGSSANNYHS